MGLRFLHIGLIGIFASALVSSSAGADCTSSVDHRSVRPGTPPKRTLFCGETEEERSRADANRVGRIEACKAAQFGELCTELARAHENAAARHHAMIARRQAEDSQREAAQRDLVQAEPGAKPPRSAERVWDTHPGSGRRA